MCTSDPDWLGELLAAALKEFDDAARWARGHRWMTNLTTGKTVARG